jgi:propionaldehyde dehydrogenase
MALDEKRIADIVARVVANLTQERTPAGSMPATDSRPSSSGTVPTELGHGVFSSVDEAAEAARKAQSELARLDLAGRERLVEAVRAAGIANAERFARLAVDETGLGRYEHKINKNINAARFTPGTEDLTKGFNADATGTTLTQGRPYGVICSILPTTHPMSMMINHAIIMVASGNAMFACPHPRAARCTREALRTLNQAIVAAGGPANLLVAVDKVSVEIVNEVLKHPAISMVTVAGGPSVIKAALSCGKRAIAAGPGNPPVLVDETADIPKAARDIVASAMFDNNILCIAEKEVFAVADICDELMQAMVREGCYHATGEEIERITNLVVKDSHVNGDFVGKDAAVILNAAGINAPPGVQGVIMEVPFEHPLVQLEQMMPVLPVVRVADFEQGLKMAVEAEHGFGHTAQIHSRNIERIERYVQALDTTIVVVNGPSYAGLGLEGSGTFSHTVASTTGEGICTPRTFTQQRNTTICRALAQY